MLWYRLKSETTHPGTGVVSALVDTLGKVSPEGRDDVIKGESDDPGAQPDAGDRPVASESQNGFFMQASHLCDGACIH